MSTNATLWLSLAVAGILVVATLDDAKAPEVKKEDDKPIKEPKKVVL